MTIINLSYNKKIWKNNHLKKKEMNNIVSIIYRKLLNENLKKEIDIYFGKDEEILKLNSQYRDKANATNVLSFTMEDNDFILGSIIFAHETIMKESIEQNKKFHDHLVHLFIHAILHLLNYDHINEDDRIIMENVEIEILKELNIGDPYFF